MLIAAPLLASTSAVAAAIGGVLEALGALSAIGGILIGLTASLSPNGATFCFS